MLLLLNNFGQLKELAHSLNPAIQFDEVVIYTPDLTECPGVVDSDTLKVTVNPDSSLSITCKVINDVVSSRTVHKSLSDMLTLSQGAGEIARPIVKGLEGVSQQVSRFLSEEGVDYFQCSVKCITFHDGRRAVEANVRPIYRYPAPIKGTMTHSFRFP